MTSIASFLLGRRDFYSESEIINYVVYSKNFDPSKENLKEAGALLTFQTSKQHTWIVATQERLYCILDDVRKDKPHINWSIRKSGIIRDGEVILEVATRERVGEGSNSVHGLVDFGDQHKNWLYTKGLFPSAAIEERTEELIKSVMA